MTEKIVLTDRALKALKAAPPGKRIVTWDAVQPHLCIRVTETGAKSFVVVKRMAGQRAPVVHVLGTYPALTLINARKLARSALGQIAEGVNPLQDRKAKQRAAASREKSSFDAVAKVFVAKHASKNRKGAEAARIIELYLTSTFGQRQIGSIKRREIAELLDDIERGQFKTTEARPRKLGGPVMADHVLAVLRKLMNWHAARDDDFISPIVKGMARTKPKERARDRVLSDDEIRALWVGLNGNGEAQENKRLATDTFAGLVRMLLLTAQRREEVAQMKRSEIGQDGTWTIPAERYKTGKPNVVPLSAAAREVIEKQDQVNKADLVFTTNGETPFSGYSKAKERLDAAMLAHLQKQLGAKATLPPWRLHDLRRTAKTLMIRAGVRPDISERVLGHVIGGVEGVYDRHSYIAEKKEALEKLAVIVQQIVNPTTDAKVVPMRRKK